MRGAVKLIGYNMKFSTWFPEDDVDYYENNVVWSEPYGNWTNYETRQRLGHAQYQHRPKGTLTWLDGLPPEYPVGYRNAAL